MKDMPLTHDQQKLVSDNIAYAEATVRKLFSRHARFVDIDEAISEAIYGLCIAAQRYNPSSNIKFTTYSYFYVFKYAIEYIRKESKILYGSKGMKDNNTVICSLDSVDNDTRVCNCVDMSQLSIIMPDLSKLEQQILSFKLIGYNKKEIAKWLNLSIQKIDILIKKIKKQIAIKLNREDLMEEKQNVDTSTTSDNKKKRGRPRKVQLAVSQSANDMDNMLKAPENKTQVTPINTCDEVSPVVSESYILNKYDIKYDVGETIYVALFSGEMENNLAMLSRKYMYRPRCAKITSIILKCDNRVCYTTTISKKVHIDSKLVFSTFKDCEQYCKTLN